MQTPILAVIILFAVIVLSAFPRVNCGLLSLAMAWLLGCFMARLSLAEVLSGFPVSMFIILTAVSYFFGIASHNGTLERITQVMIRRVKGKRILFPLIFFGLAVVLSTLGAGNIGAVALLAPVAMAVAEKSALSAFFMTVMLIFGANAGTFSPFAFTGVIANGLVAKQGLTMNPWTEIYLPSLLVQTFIASVNYVLFCFLLKKDVEVSMISAAGDEKPIPTISSKQSMTLGAMVVLIFGVSLFKLDVGYLALGLAILLKMVGAAHGKEELKRVPWGIVFMVCGMSTLVSVVEKVGGMDILITGLSRISNPKNITAVLAFIVGITSSFSSSSAVVMPTFIPLIPGLIEKMGSGNPAALVSSINIGTHVVDVSPLSTLGALCLANAAKSENKIKLFRQLFVYGLSMSLVGALVSGFFFGLR